MGQKKDARNIEDFALLRWLIGFRIRNEKTPRYFEGFCFIYLLVEGRLIFLRQQLKGRSIYIIVFEIYLV